MNKSAPLPESVTRFKLISESARLLRRIAAARARAESHSSRALGGAEPRASVNLANHAFRPLPRGLAPLPYGGSRPRARSPAAPGAGLSGAAHVSQSGQSRVSSTSRAAPPLRLPAGGSSWVSSLRSPGVAEGGSVLGMEWASENWTSSGIGWGVE